MSEPCLFYLVQLVAGSPYAHSPARSYDRPGPLVFGGPNQAANVARRLRSVAASTGSATGPRPERHPELAEGPESAEVAIAAEGAGAGEDAPWEFEGLTRLAGKFAGGPPDLSSRHHEYYVQALAAECRPTSS